MELRLENKNLLTKFENNHTHTEFSSNNSEYELFQRNFVQNQLNDCMSLIRSIISHYQNVCPVFQLKINEVQAMMLVYLAQMNPIMTNL